MNKETSGVNSVEDVSVQTELYLQPETLTASRVPPPPYSPPISDTITIQPLPSQVVLLEGPLKHRPVYHTCSTCGSQVLTEVKHENSVRTHMLAGFLFGLTCWCCICCVGFLPYYIKKCKTAEHYCPNCGTLIGKYSII